MAHRWVKNGNRDLILGGSKITADGDCSHEIKRHLLLGKATTNLYSILSRDITLLTKVHLVKVMVFPVVRYGCESWTTNKAEHWRIDTFELWCWRRLLRVPWTARKSNHSIPKKINPEYSLEGLMLKLKLQYFGHLMWRTDSLEKTLMLGKTRREEKGTTEDEMVGWHQWHNGHEVWILSGSWWWTGRPRWKKACSSWGLKELDTTERLNWTNGQGSSHGTNLSTWVPTSISNLNVLLQNFIVITVASVFNCNCALCNCRGWDRRVWEHSC